MKKCMLTMLNISLSLTLVAVLTINAGAATAPRITKEELKPMLGTSDVIVLDVRTGMDWKASEYKIKGAVRVNHTEVESLASRYGKDKVLVIY